MGGMRRVLWGVAGLLLSLQAMADVYKYIDKDGNLVLTDKKVPGAVPVVVPPTMTMPFPKGAPALPAATSEAAGAYTITITSPAPGSTYRRNQDSGVPIAASVSPELQEGLTLQVLLDGAPVSGDAVSLDQVTRGSHTVSARIVDSAGKVVEDGPSNTFYVQQVSGLLGPNAKPRGGSGQGY